jgi:hypothetical protein
VEHETCDECGFDGGRFDDHGLVAAIRELGAQWRTLLGSAADELRVRPAEQVWSALEYAAHSRDITAIHVLGVEYALTEDNATVPAVDGDDLIQSAAGQYANEEVTAVIAAVERETQRLAAVAADRVRDWDRTLTVGDNANTVRRMLEHALHDSTHHLADVERGLAQIRGS